MIDVRGFEVTRWYPNRIDSSLRESAVTCHQIVMLLDLGIEHDPLQANSYTCPARFRCLTPWPEILDQPQQHARAGIGVGGFDMLGRVMADAAAAADEQHGDV